MKKNIFICLCLSAFFALATSGCKEDSDTQKPVINLIEPAEGDALKIGDEHGVHFEVEFTDNEALASYKVNIHPNFDNHTHASLRAGTVDFEFEKSWQLTDETNPNPKNKPVHHHEIKIPEDATPGAYHLTVYCTDKAGNEEHITVNIVLSHNVEDDDEEEHEHNH
jgi:hypothetical protein